MEKAHLEIILENMDSKFELVLEGQESLRKEMYGIRDELSEKIELNSFKIDVLNKKIDGVEHRLDTKIDAVEQSLDGKIDSVHTELKEHIKAVADDLREHRRDTELHHGYQIRED